MARERVQNEKRRNEIDRPADCLLFLFRKYPADRPGDSGGYRRGLELDLSVAALSHGISGAAGAGPAGDPVGMPSQAAGKFQVSPPLWGDLCGFSRTGVAGILEWKEKEEV